MVFFWGFKRPVTWCSLVCEAFAVPVGTYCECAQFLPGVSELLPQLW